MEPELFDAINHYITWLNRNQQILFDKNHILLWDSPMGAAFSISWLIRMYLSLRKSLAVEAKIKLS